MRPSPQGKPPASQPEGPQQPKEPKETRNKTPGRKNHRWTQEELEIIKRDYQGTTKSRLAIAERLGVTQFAVAGQIARLGLCQTSDRKRWTPEEDGRLAELVFTLSMTQVAKEMNRSINAVTIRAKRLKLSRRIRNDWYTLNEVTEILGKDHHWVRRRIDDGRLKATPHYDRVPQATGGSSWHINRKDLKAFLQAYPHELNGRNVDLVAIVDILAGLKPFH